MSRAIRSLVLVCLLALLGACGDPRSESEPPPDDSSRDQVSSESSLQVALASLQSVSRSRLRIHFGPRHPRFISMRVPVDRDSDPVERALAFLDEHRELYQLEDPWAQLYPEKVDTDPSGGSHVRLAQRWNGRPVYGGAISVHVAGDEIIATMGAYLPELAPDAMPPGAPAAKPTMSRAAMTTEAYRYAEKKGAVLEVLGEGQLIFFNPKLLGDARDELHLALRLPVREGRLERVYYVDAHDGRVVHASTEERTHAANKEFDLKTANGGDAKCWFIAGGNQWFTEDGPTDEYPGGPMSYPGGDVDGDLIYRNTHAVWDFFHDNFHRNSYDDGGEEVVSYIHVTFRDDDGRVTRNASYKGGVCDVFQFSDNAVALDIVGHEFMHAVTDFNYEFQSGAIDESYADVFGELIEEENGGADWLTDSFRSLQDPPSRGDPDHWTNYRALPHDNDKGGVHTNSGIPNKAAYLLAEGGTHGGSGVAVAPIGTDKMKHLYYEVSTSWLHSNATMSDLRDATVTAAQQYALEGRHGFTSRDACSVINAFGAVGLGTPDRDCDGEPDDIDRDDDGDYVPDEVDNCVNDHNSLQWDEDGDGLGNACDPDIDGDGVPNDEDNCPERANRSQSDIDRDGIGEACDDDDRDGRFNTEDNCRSQANYDQNDSDGDGVGDACDGDRDGDGVPNTVDNCPDTPSSVQRDLDGDGVGDACDNCPEVPSTNVSDVDGDGLGDVCDADIDGDGIPNRADNCAYSFNPEQFDIDTNGIGTACDDREPGVIGNEIPLVIRELERHVRASDVIRVPLSPCRVGDCPRILPEGLRANLTIVSDSAIQVRVVDDFGKLAARGQLEERAPANPNVLTHGTGGFDSKLRHSVSFEVAADAHFDDGVEVFQGRRYFVEILPLESSKSSLSIAAETHPAVR